MIPVEPSPSVERARQLLSDPDRYFAQARLRAAQETKAEWAAQEAIRRAGRRVRATRPDVRPSGDGIYRERLA